MSAPANTARAAHPATTAVSSDGGRRRGRARRAVRATGGLVLAVALLVGCSDKDSSDGGAAKPTAAVSTTTAPASVSPGDLPEAPELSDATGVRADVTIDACAQGAPLEASGTVKNTAKRAADIVVTVNWINSTSDVLARGVDVLENVGAGKKVSWSVTSAEEIESGLTCSINAQRGNLAG